MSQLKTNLTSIQNELSTKLIPKNIKKGVDILNTVGTYAGGDGDVISQDVNFIDYDGTLLYSYTASNFAKLTELPANPTHEGLTAQGWNWSLSDAKTYVAEYGKLWIGQMYITDDNKTRIYIHLEDGRLSPYLGFAINGTATVEWGDGTSEDITGTSTSTVIYTQHNYASSGDYVIKLSSDSTIYLLGDDTKKSYLISNNANTRNENRMYLNSILKIELGSNIYIHNSAFNNLNSLQNITIPNNTTVIGNRAIYGCYTLRGLVIPSGVTYIYDNTFDACYSLRNISVPNTIIHMRANVFATNFSLRNIIIPNNVVDIRKQCVN